MFLGLNFCLYDNRINFTSSFVKNLLLLFSSNANVARVSKTGYFPTLPPYTLSIPIMAAIYSEGIPYSFTAGYRGKTYDIKKDTKLKKFILNAVHQTSEDNDWSDVKDIGLYIKQNSSFSPINHGFNKLGDMIKALELFDVAYTNDRLTMLIREKLGKYPKIGNLKDFTF